MDLNPISFYPFSLKADKINYYLVNKREFQYSFYRNIYYPGNLLLLNLKDYKC